MSHGEFENRPESLQGKRLDNYELIRMLGEGGMAQVYLARDVRLGREVAVKVLDSRLAERSSFRERFQREARLAAALDHPNIVPLFDYGERSDVFFLIMPYLSGGSLQEQLSKTPFSMVDIMRYGTQVTDALEYAHERNVIHRDVKPANMMLHGDGRLMLGDFGLAKIFDGGAQRVNRMGRPDAGTPEYMAPEQVQGHTDARSDLYGLGVVLYLLATGRLPFYGSSSQAVMDGHLYQTPLSPRQINPAVTAAVEEVIMRALSKNPEERYQSAREMGGALVAALVAGGAEPLPFAANSSSGGNGLFLPPVGGLGSRPNAGSNGFGQGSSSVSQLPELGNIPLTPSRPPAGIMSPHHGGSLGAFDNSMPSAFTSQSTGSMQQGMGGVGASMMHGPMTPAAAPFSTPMGNNPFAGPQGYTPAPPDRGSFSPHMSPPPQPRSVPAQTPVVDDETAMVGHQRNWGVVIAVVVLGLVLLGAAGYLASSILLK